MSNQKPLIFPGMKIGLLEVGDLVRNVKDHPLYPETPLSYIAHWRLFECHCECGAVKLISENALSGGKVKSCGCIRARQRQEAWERRQSKAQRKQHKREISFRLSCAMDKLSLLRLAPPGLRDETKIEEIGVEIRKLRAMKAFANRKV